MKLGVIRFLTVRRYGLTIAKIIFWADLIIANDKLLLTIFFFFTFVKMRTLSISSSVVHSIFPFDFIWSLRKTFCKVGDNVILIIIISFSLLPKSFYRALFLAYIMLKQYFLFLRLSICIYVRSSHFNKNKMFFERKNYEKKLGCKVLLYILQLFNLKILKYKRY